MKEYIDFYATLQGELFAKRKLAARLKKHWGTTSINGVEVYNSVFVIWPGTHTERVRKVLDILSDSELHKNLSINCLDIKLRFSEANFKKSLKDIFYS